MDANIFSNTHGLTVCPLKKLASGVFPESWKVLAERRRRWRRRRRRRRRKRTKNNKSPGYPGWLIKWRYSRDVLHDIMYIYSTYITWCKYVIYDIECVWFEVNSTAISSYSCWRINIDVIGVPVIYCIDIHKRSLRACVVLVENNWIFACFVQHPTW